MEICSNNDFGTICELGWDENDAAVACRQLGFPGESELTCGTMLLHHSQVASIFIDSIQLLQLNGRESEPALNQLLEMAHLFRCIFRGYMYVQILCESVH